MESNDEMELRFEGNKFLLIENRTSSIVYGFDCCDTISYGTWERQADNLLTLDSDPSLLRILEVEVEESRSDSDKFTITIDNPIEEFYTDSRRNKEARDIVYEVVVSTEKYKFFAFDLEDTNEVSRRNNKGKTIREIKVQISVNHNFYGRELGVRYPFARTYVVKDPASNVFEINIPELTYEYLIYRRLRQDYVEVLSNRRIKYDGEVYCKR